VDEKMRLVEEQTVAINSLKAREMAVVKELREAEEAQWEARRLEFQEELRGMQEALADCQSFMAQADDEWRARQEQLAVAAVETERALAAAEAARDREAGLRAAAEAAAAITEASTRETAMVRQELAKLQTEWRDWEVRH
jgi:hypothetical protein